MTILAILAWLIAGSCDSNPRWMHGRETVLSVSCTDNTADMWNGHAVLRW